MASYERARRQVADLARRELDLLSFWHEAKGILEKTVPHYLTPCWYALDPASLLVTIHYDHGMIPELPQEWLAHQYNEDDFHKIADVARSDRGISTLHEATGGDPRRSAAWRAFVEPYGGDQEVLVALRTRTGESWGTLALYREPGRPQFDPDELAFLRAISPYLAEGVQRGLLSGEAVEPEGPDAPGLVVLDPDWEIESMTAGAEQWLSELPGAEPSGGRLPPSVLAVAGRALRTAESPDAPGDVAVSRVLSQAGRWIVLHGSALMSGATPRAAVIIEPASGPRVSSLLMSAYQLTEREQEVTRLVLQGKSTAEIAEELVVSPHTVQEHLKGVFEKTGVRSRRDLVAKIFFGHYEPRLRDNEQRVREGRPLRGGPVESTGTR